MSCDLPKSSDQSLRPPTTVTGGPLLPATAKATLMDGNCTVSDGHAMDDLTSCSRFHARMVLFFWVFDYVHDTIDSSALACSGDKEESSRVVDSSPANLVPHEVGNLSKRKETREDRTRTAKRWLSMGLAWGSERHLNHSQKVGVLMLSLRKDRMCPRVLVLGEAIFGGS